MPGRRPLSDPTVVRTCPKCGASGRACDLFYFYKNGPKKGSITQAHCKACEYERVTEHKQRRPKYGPPVPKGAPNGVRGRVRSRNTRHVIVNGVECRPCTKCGEVLPLERFTLKQTTGHYSSQCKTCRTAFERAQRLAGKRVDMDPARTKAVSKAWRDANPELKRMATRRRRARLRDAGPMITLAEWMEIQEAWGHRCAYCGVHAPGDLTMDHVIPVVRGGNSDAENIAPACGARQRNCNARKAARTAMEFVHASDGSGPLVAVA